MASPIISKAPQCMSCIRRAGLENARYPAAHQVRGKKRMAKVGTIKVHLLQNVPGYGRRGAVIPIPPGMMRNEWFPRRVAEYVTRDKLGELGVMKGVPLERDSTFMSSVARKAEKERLKRDKEEIAEQQAADVAKAAEAEALAITEAEYSTAAANERAERAQQAGIPEERVALPNPQEAIGLLEQLLPPNLDFYRTPITISTPKKISPSLSSSAFTSLKSVEPITPALANIYGSVSTNDIAVNLKAILAEDEKGAQVVLTPNEISFVNVTEEKDRVKSLGVYDIEITLGGATGSIRRTIKVNAQD